MALLSAATLLSFSLLASAQTDNGDECSCFRTNGSSANYFLYHRFQDFRNIDPSVASGEVPSVIANGAGTTNAPPTSDFFTADQWNADWEIQSWNNSDSIGSDGSDATVLMINSANNVYIEKSTDDTSDYSTYLTLRTSRQPTFQSAAEIDSTEQNYLHLSARFMARVTGSSGACAGLFTYLAPTNNDPMTVQEADIEILTSGPRNAVQYTNQPSNNAKGDILTQATSNATNPGDIDWTQWMVYRVDWTPGKTSWYVDGASVATIKYQAPKDPAGLIINMWSDGGSWTGNMSTYDEAYLQLQWMEVVYNTSGSSSGSSGTSSSSKSSSGGGIESRDESGAGGFLSKRKSHPGCKVVCSVDEEVNVTGTPAVLYNSTGTGTPLAAPSFTSGAFYTTLLLLLGFTLVEYF